MLAVAAEGSLYAEVLELTLSALEETVAHNPTELTFRFLVGTEKNVKI